MIIYEPDDNEEAIASIPLENLGDSGLVVHKYDEWKEGEPTKPNNVLIGCIDRLSNVAIVGVDRESGEMYCAASDNDPESIQLMLAYFSNMLEDYKEE
ncbi:MAG: hypothetical protein Tp178MES00d2C33159091_43 [Prokaryotic dsDNA virus sp.]|uniref:hypothetical protein n=1 Tax=Thalassospira sp. TaxID=1912094 RepID=UPI000C419936|nr:hypothetical protein [Thalassospira sp.]MAZ33877.1 hypothetical protein [Thalassospira sp.]MAZ34630.1 hypothetical protein [Thalassospira sp.]QDP60992.1 MAG: hypothetical protein Tp178MES00d2C33159091_43 [Prokaryotic dsDNA virus sp.]QDP64503.1 MAG: hypothetical protein Tp178SUR1139111_23 [Prokaryotic dsDNA virus sp.]|tara:strand:+ start:871 stop:1164 length:294 start_codon:yes stop_codon:yes gene_type:complete